MIRVAEAKFLTSSPSLSKALENTKHNEIVMMARSNVGKSSLINRICNKKGLAKTSSTPGKTRLINFFSLNLLKKEESIAKECVLVDLPGFGYSKVSKEVQKEWERNLSEFVEKRPTIALFLHLVDARHPELEIDKQVQSYIEHIKDDTQVYIKVFTKIDKLNQKERSVLKKSYPDVPTVSNLKGTGHEKVLELMFEVIET